MPHPDEQKDSVYTAAVRLGVMRIAKLKQELIHVTDDMERDRMENDFQKIFESLVEYVERILYFSQESDRPEREEFLLMTIALFRTFLSGQEAESLLKEFCMQLSRKFDSKTVINIPKADAGNILFRDKGLIPCMKNRDDAVLGHCNRILNEITKVFRIIQPRIRL